MRHPVEVNTTKKHCKKCKYRGYATYLGGVYCNYCNINKKTRGCEARHCDKYVKGNAIKRSITPQHLCKEGIDGY